MPRKADSRFASLAGQSGRDYWRSLGELAETEEFLEALNHEFPAAADTWNNDTSRRGFLKLMGASLALAGIGGCFQQPPEKIVPYVDPPESVIPGKPQYYATSWSLRGRAIPLLVESHMGRPTKIEGNIVRSAEEQKKSRNETKITFGPTDIFSQASILTLYDPDRSETPLFRGQTRTLRQFREAINRELDTKAEKLRLRLLTGSVTSPTVGKLIEQVKEKFPETQWHQWEAANRDAEFDGLKVAFGKPVEPRFDLSKAKVILSLDDDFLMSSPESLSAMAGYAAARKQAVASPESGAMSRLYVVDGAVSATGAKADHRLPLRPSRIPALAASIAASLGVDGIEAIEDNWPAEIRKFVDAVVSDLKEHAAESVVLAGQTQPAAVHTLAALINQQLGSVGNTVSYIEPLDVEPVNHTASVASLAADMKSGDVDLLIMIGGNPAYDAPADLDFSEALKSVPLRVHLSEYDDETSVESHWHIPRSHPLECWGDSRLPDGTLVPQQPLIAPLYESRSDIEMLALLAGRRTESAVDIVKQVWGEARSLSGRKLEDFWQTTLHDGFVPESASQATEVSVANDATDKTASALKSYQGVKRSEVELTFRVDPCIFDGSMSNNGWLQELPKPLTKLTWDNAAYVSPKTAEEKGWARGEFITVELPDVETPLTLPVFVVPGHAEETISVSLGYGRSRAGSVGSGTGFNVYPGRRSDRLWIQPDPTIRKAEGKYLFATTQDHHLLEGRELIRSGTFDELKKHPEDPHFMHTHHEAPDVSFYPPVAYEGYKWGMLVDMTACIGCNACVVACQSENNIPVVGKEQVAGGREMHWIRLDTYYEGAPENPETHFQAVACQHCELAPCEVVCPVGATTHSPEGINEMTYNRCVGTRYCSNNCPYKVRRFNFLDYTPYEDFPVLKMLQNPDVTVRNRGVMEKCTFCVQRINGARIQSELDDTTLKDGDVQTACQASCPAKAITFGDLNDEQSEIAKQHEGPLTFGLLEELNTRPRTRYTATVSNPHPSLKSEKPDVEHH